MMWQEITKCSLQETEQNVNSNVYKIRFQLIFSYFQLIRYDRVA